MRRRRLFAAILIAVGLIVVATRASATGVQSTDPAGDVDIDKADIDGMGINYANGLITLGAHVVNPTNPKSDQPMWSREDTFLRFLIQLNTSSQAEFAAVFDSPNNTAITGELRDFKNDHVNCDVEPTFTTNPSLQNNFFLQFASACIGNPASIKIQVEFMYSTGSTSQTDRAPDAAQTYCCTVTHSGTFPTTTTTTVAPTTTTTKATTTTTKATTSTTKAPTTSSTSSTSSTVSTSSTTSTTRAVATSTTFGAGPTSSVAVISPATAAPGQQVTISGGGFAPRQTLNSHIESTPIGLGSTVTDNNGNFSFTVTLPTSLAAGTHTIFVDGVGANGAFRQVTGTIQITGAAAQVLGTKELKVTGGKVDTLLIAGLLTMGYGAVLMFIAGTGAQANAFRVRDGLGYVHRSMRRNS